MLIDSHCHLDSLTLDHYDHRLSAAIDAAVERGVERMLCVGVSVNNRERVVAIAETYRQVVAAVGIHPLNLEEGRATEKQLLAWSQHPKVVALGETGLDYHYSSQNKSLQQQSFATHLRAAALAELPVIVHTRDARDDTLALIKEHGDSEYAGVLHCFTESWQMAKQTMDMNYMISLSGIVTFRNAEELRTTAKMLPLDRLLIETDSPYLAPVPFRGRPNEPKYVHEVADFIAQLKGIHYRELARITEQNFYRLFKKAAQ